ncbi:MAG TPA: hypothetical protein VNT33_15835 [Telluria sp.]|nr:hypothetical protein [Telluria sp.]
MKRTLLIGAALAAAQPAVAGDLFKGMLQQAVNGVAQQTANKVQSAATNAVNAAFAPPATPPSQAAPAPVPAAPVKAAPDGMVSTPLPEATGGKTGYQFTEPFYGEYIAEYWARPDAPVRGDTASEDALGNILSKPPFNGDGKQPGVADIQRKLAVLLARTLEHPALKNIRGSSLRAGSGIVKARGGAMKQAVAGSASLIAYQVFLDNKQTKQFPDGTYHTFGLEGPSLEIAVNNTDVLEERWPVGSFNGGIVVARGGMYMLVIPNSDRPVYLTEGTGRSVRYKLNPDLIDPSRPPGEVQLLTVYVGMASNTQSDIVHRKVKPTSNAGRLYGAMFSTDWPALLKEANAK